MKINKTGSHFSLKAVLVALVFASFVSSWSGLMGQGADGTTSVTAPPVVNAYMLAPTMFTPPPTDPQIPTLTPGQAQAEGVQAAFRAAIAGLQTAQAPQSAIDAAVQAVQAVQMMILKGSPTIEEAKGVSVRTMQAEAALQIIAPQNPAAVAAASQAMAAALAQVQAAALTQVAAQQAAAQAATPTSAEALQINQLNTLFSSGVKSMDPATLVQFTNGINNLISANLNGSLSPGGQLGLKSLLLGMASSNISLLASDQQAAIQSNMSSINSGAPLVLLPTPTAQDLVAAAAKVQPQAPASTWDSSTYTVSTGGTGTGKFFYIMNIDEENIAASSSAVSQFTMTSQPFYTLVAWYVQGKNGGKIDAAYNQQNQFLTATLLSSTLDDLQKAYWQGYQDGWTYIQGYMPTISSELDNPQYYQNYKTSLTTSPKLDIISNQRSGYDKGKTDAIARQPNQYEGNLASDLNFYNNLFHATDQDSANQLLYWIAYNEGYRIYATDSIQDGTADAITNATSKNPVDMSAILINFSN